MQTIGERLEEARKKKGISIREAAESTKIRGDYLQKFENNQFDIGLTEIYTRGFLRTYANFLKLPADRILNDYAALGRGEVRPRQPNREVYGRMDISVATAAEAAERAAPPEEPAANDASPARSAPGRSRAATSLPTGPDPAVVFRYIKWGGIAVVALVALWVVKALVFDRAPEPAARQTTTPPPSPEPAANTPAPNERTITLIASDVVAVKVNRKIGSDTEGQELFKGTLTRGQSQAVPFPGPIFIWFSAGENLRIEYKGRVIQHNMTGVNRVALE